MKSRVLFVVFFCWSLQVACQAQTQPNIVLIMADDLGWNDVSFHGSSEILTPNIDALAYNGVILNRFYTPPMCSPSRASLMTGKYPNKLGMQHHVILSDEPWGLSLDEKLMPQYFKNSGYRTSLIGKWHLGFHRQQFTPTKRGFDTFFGYLGPYIGYYDYTLFMKNKNYSRGYDMRRNLDVAHFDGDKIYATELFTNEAVKVIKNHNKKSPMFLMVSHLAPHAGNEDSPMEPPENEIENFKYIQDKKRQILAAKISVLDKSVGEIVKAIKKKGIMENTIILFISDNGGPTIGKHSTKASNYPLRGQKKGLWEGGTRTVACIYSPLIKKPHRVSNEFIHIVDLLPTFLSATNITKKFNENDIDGIDQWKTISEGETTTRKEILYNYENIRGYSALMLRSWKIINGTDNIDFAGWLGDSGYENINITHDEYFQAIQQSKVANMFEPLNSENVQKMRDEATVKCGHEEHLHSCNPLRRPCLFNIIEDPCEKNNLARSKPEIVKLLISQLSDHVLETVPSLRQKSDPRSDPKNFNFTWSPWLDDDITEGDDFPMIIVAILIFMPVFFVFLARTKKKKNPRFQTSTAV